MILIRCAAVAADSDGRLISLLQSWLQTWADAVIEAGGSGPNEHEHAIAVIAAFGRQFCDRCWRRLPKKAFNQLEAMI